MFVDPTVNTVLIELKFNKVMKMETMHLMDNIYHQNIGHIDHSSPMHT